MKRRIKNTNKFGRVFEFFKTLDYRHYICGGITVLFVLLCGEFPNALGRVLESIRDFCVSIAYFFCEPINELLGWLSGGEYGFNHGIVPTVNEYPKIPFFGSSSSVVSAPLPAEWTTFKQEWSRYWRAFANWNNFRAYLLCVVSVVFTLGTVLFYAATLLFLLWLWLKRFLKKQPKVEFDEHGKALNANKDSKALKRHRAFTFRIYQPFKRWVTDFFAFIRENGFWWKIWLGIWAYYFNVFTIILEFVAFLLYFLVSFDYQSLYRQVYKLSFDLATPFFYIPVWAWVVLALFFLNRYFKKLADVRLQHYINYDRGFGSSRSLFTIICATVGAGKTTMLVHMGLLDRLNHRDRAFEDMLKNDLKFPNFPWINLEKSLVRAIDSGIVRDLKTTRDFIDRHEAYFNAHPKKRNCFGYDYTHYGFTYNDGLKVLTVWDVVKSYAQQYFIYLMETSMLANFGVRLDDIKEDLGHFPLWNSDFLSRDPRLMDAYSRHCKILDFNALRIGMKMTSDNAFVYNFEFGTILITEIGKELMNDKELRDMGIKFIAVGANQKNDGTINEIKLIRHSATVDGFPYVVIRADEQRPESLGANVRDLFEIVHIRERGDIELALPFFSLYELFYASVLNKFAQIYYQYRFIRSDNTLPMHLLKGFVAKVEHYYERTYNRYGYRVLKGEIERGTQDGVMKDFKYYLITKIIYARRFATDCYSGYFDERIAACTVGLAGLPEYKTEKATFEEMQMQNSYMVNNLLDGINED